MNPTPQSLLDMPNTNAVCQHWYLPTRRLALQSNAYAARDIGIAEPVIRTYVARDEGKFGFSGQTKESKLDTVQMYPNVQIGRHPWDDWTTDGWTPKKLHDLPSLTVDLEIEWDADGEANVAFDLWLVKNPNGVGADNIACEVMVWLDHRGRFQPAGNMVEAQVPYTTVGDSGLELWMAPGFGEGTWPIFTFVANPPAQVMEQPNNELALLLHHLVHRGSIAKDNEFWLSAIEFGNEVIAGSWWMQVNKFDVRAA